jgi:hypothetical protein
MLAAASKFPPGWRHGAHFGPANALRDVALKALPEVFAHDADRMARFEREAQVLASLNHPNIAQIYGVEVRALVMELWMAPSLKARKGIVKLGRDLPNLTMPLELFARRHSTLKLACEVPQEGRVVNCICPLGGT